MSLVLGLDAGGTSTRCLVTDERGVVHGRGRAGGGNPIARPPAEALEQFRLAVSAAVSDVDPSQVEVALLGVAGTGDRPEMPDVLGAVLRSCGVGCPVLVRGDAEVAFAAGTPEPDGTVLIAGTGAVSAQVVGGREGRTHDGWGWLLGDDGSGFWIGREAVRVALRSFDTGEPGPLAARVLELLTGGAVGRSELVLRVHADPPVALAALAPLVLEAAVEGDPEAVDVVERAADRLLAAVDAVRPPGESTPVVLAGGIASSVVVGEPLVARLGERWPAAPLRVVVSAEAGAAWLAARLRWPDVGEDVHRRLCQPRVVA
ncbi:N-acetylglucosamine kinase [Auraticoccus monumenti]|uniref:BadF-type ATPase n=1 Tax=Auraticoccus monumenti TaxID=675864 RepID=A0A1G6TVV2_9ACTN|nr:BadF/BadG/BcrA/BcrD ATPase family protein [Auraticoccus monumenti]SDD32497.1 BadF-type ATPase [Auraticoccus monumenti]